MPGSNIFQSYKRANAELLESGYLKFYLNLLDDFITLQEPPALTDDSVTGDNKIIVDAHDWKAGKKPMTIYVDAESLEAPADTVGDKQSLKLQWTIKVFMIGDGPVSQDLAESFLNQDLVGFTSDECPTAETLQYGCDCSPARVVKGSFSSGTIISGKKGYSFEIQTLSRFFYRGGAIQARS